MFHLCITGVFLINGCAQKANLARTENTVQTPHVTQPQDSAEPQQSISQQKAVSEKSTANRTTKKSNKPSLQGKSTAESAQPATTASSNYPSITLNSPFKLKYGQKRSLPNSELNFKISKVSDSRCPLEMQCVQQGNAVITLLLYRNSTRIDVVNINTNNDNLPLIKDRQYAYHFRLLELQPYPTVQFIEPQHYVAELIITKSSLE
jgi:hypothetical protein